MNQDRLLHSKQIEKAFKLFDDDGNGFIDLGELKGAMNGLKLTDREWKELIKQYDSDGDGVISCDEFKNLLLNISTTNEEKL